MRVTVSAQPTLAVLPLRRSFLFLAPVAGRGPNSGSQRPQLPERASRRSRQGAEIVAAPDDDGEGRGPLASRQDGGG